MPLKKNIIHELGLSEIQVVEIVRLWYTNGMFAPILHDTRGCDLEEICERIINDLGNNVYSD